MSCGNPKCTHPDCVGGNNEGDNVRRVSMAMSQSLRVDQALGDALNYHAVDPMEKVKVTVEVQGEVVEIEGAAANAFPVKEK